jgi:hypothetical protein
MIYPLATVHTNTKTVTPGLPGASTFVLIVRTLSHQLRMPHFLELLVKVALSVTLDYPFQK